MMRIITGSARGTKLQAPEGESTRPTAERTKEAIFSMLQNCFVGCRVLDLFGGSGQLGLEALSRGAANAVFVDGGKEQTEIIKKNVVRTHFENRATVHQSEALSFLKKENMPFGLVFLDPPYAAKLLPSCLSLLCERRLLTPDAVLVLEAGNEADFFGGNKELEEKFDILRSNRYGAAHILLLRPATEVQL